jgi:hypothetical protein
VTIGTSDACTGGETNPLLPPIFMCAAGPVLTKKHHMPGQIFLSGSGEQQAVVGLSEFRGKLGRARMVLIRSSCGVAGTEVIANSGPAGR